MTSLLLGMTLALSMPISSTLYATEVIEGQTQTSEEIMPSNEVPDLERSQEDVAGEEIGDSDEEATSTPQDTTTVLEELTPIAEEKSLSELVMTIGKKQATLNGKTYTLSTAPRIIKDRTYLPIRFVVENILQAQVDFNHAQKQIVIHKTGMRIVLEVGKTTATVNGNKVTLDGAPVIDASTTLVPIRFLSENFGLKVDYQHATKTVTISQKDEMPNSAPVARFAFEKDNYMEGETISLTENSYDEDGDHITEKMWELSGKGRSQDVTTLLKNLKAGTYTLGLKVKDARGLWSSTYTQTVTVVSNQPPKITSFTTKKASYAQGEALEFDYTYDNEPGEGITKERWTYRSKNEATNQAVITKPYAFFAQGEYIVTLQLTDAAGKVSEEVQTTVRITSEAKQTE